MRLAASLGGKAHTAFKRKLYYEQLEVKQQAQLLQKRDGFFWFDSKKAKVVPIMCVVPLEQD